ncbi:DNA mismatch repair protein MutS [Nitrogeniibacter mangrovi]|uniref:DNA mismatch repair protein MutS n=2 Tax=Nitrogeniibacter mangrovi TaxID=2016596 RepID=A0A6C1BA38_9RHOO|nr:DNA mismatch repair protein MutS [Nitrogeniibacter mangrovi]
MKESPAATPAAPAPAPAQRRPAPADTVDDELELFRRAVGDATPMDAPNRVVLEPERPAPVPRPRDDADSDAPQTTSRPATLAGDDSAYFRHLMHDVTPLADRNLAETDALKPDPGPLPPTDSALDPEDVLGLLAAGTTPLKDKNRIEIDTPPPVPAPRQLEADARAVLDESLDPFTLEDRLDIGEEAVFLRPGLPRRVLADLRRGRWVVQGEIDLHGLTRDEARAALGEFLARALLRGWRCVRVVHGKGLRSPGKVGVLKHLSRGWLAQREEILAFCQARAHEGGSGALRVLLRAADKRSRP